MASNAFLRAEMSARQSLVLSLMNAAGAKVENMDPEEALEKQRDKRLDDLLAELAGADRPELVTIYRMVFDHLKENLT